MHFIIGNSSFSLPVLLLDAECLQLSLKCSTSVGPESGVLRDLVVLGGLSTPSFPDSHCGLHCLHLERKMSLLDGCFTCWAKQLLRCSGDGLHVGDVE